MAKKIWNLFTTLIVLAAVFLAVALVGARIAGMQVYSVLSGSMEPAYMTGSLIYVRAIDASEIKDGTVISFLIADDTVATHRVIEVIPDEEDASVVRYRTKGDANEHPDAALVHSNNVLGTPVFSIPYAGYYISYIRQPPGCYIAISAGAILLLLAFLPDALAADEKGRGEAAPSEGEDEAAPPPAARHKSAARRKSAAKGGYTPRH